MQILVLNSGSSSLKFAVLNPDTGKVYLSGLAERLGASGACITLDSFLTDERIRKTEGLNGAHAQAISRVLEEIDLLGLHENLKAIAHRVVHGGEHFNTPVIATDEVKQAILKAASLAPLHNFAHLTGIEVAQQTFSDLPHVVVFDTAFHQTMPDVAYRYALPTEWYKENFVRKYGFHGTSHSYVAQQALEYGVKNIITAHLGNGSSVAAIENGVSMDTSMGMTPLDGLVMGTRSGSIDPAITEYIARERNLNIAQITEIFNKKSGLLALSEQTNDMRELENLAMQGDEKAKLAVDKFIYELAKNIMAHSIALSSLEAIVFTGGIGENSEIVRLGVGKYLHKFGLEIDENKNKSTIRGKSGIISTENSKIKAIVINTNEELMIARLTKSLIN